MTYSSLKAAGEAAWEAQQEEQTDLPLLGWPNCGKHYHKGARLKLDGSIDFLYIFDWFAQNCA